MLSDDHVWKPPREKRLSKRFVNNHSMRSYLLWWICWLDIVCLNKLIEIWRSTEHTFQHSFVNFVVVLCSCLRNVLEKINISHSHFDFKSKQQTFWALQSLISMVPKDDHCWKTSHITFHNPHAPNRLDRMHIMDSFCLRWFSDLPLKSILIIYIPLNFQDACQKIPPMDHIAHVPIPKMCVLVLSHFIEIWQNHKGKRKVALSF